MQTVENSNSYRKIYMFANGYGASIISSDFSYGGRCGQGLFEVAVLDKDGNLCYDSPITNDVIGWLDFAGVADILKQIENL